MNTAMNGTAAPPLKLTVVPTTVIVALTGNGPLPPPPLPPHEIVVAAANPTTDTVAKNRRIRAPSFREGVPPTGAEDTRAGRRGKGRAPGSVQRISTSSARKSPVSRSTTPSTSTRRPSERLADVV